MRSCTLFYDDPPRTQCYFGLSSSPIANCTVQLMVWGEFKCNMQNQLYKTANRMRLLMPRLFFSARSYCSAQPQELLKREIYQGNSVVRLILNDTKRRNAMSLEMIDELNKELRSISNISKVRAVIIAAEGPAFSSGHDLKQFRSSEGSANHQKVFDGMTNMLQLVQRMQVPVIAEVSGVAAAAGCQLVASCDIVVAGESAKFMVPGQKVGLFCSTPGIALVRAVNRKVAMDMLLTGEPIDSKTALSCGLVSRVVPDDQVKFEALKVAEQIGQHSRSVTALGKTFFYAQAELKQAEAYRYGSVVMTENLKMTDAQEGIKAFIEKRKPEFSHTDERVTEGEGEKKE